MQIVDQRNVILKKILFLLTTLLSSAACSLDASILSMELIPPKPVEFLQRHNTDFIHGEVVTVYSGSKGYQIRAVFGELEEETQSLNGSPWSMKGVFYE